MAVLLLYAMPCLGGSKEKVQPYKGYTGTVHQFGFIGGAYFTANPNYSPDYQKAAFRDYGLGAAYTLHDYFTRQIAMDVITSVTLLTSKALEVRGADSGKLKMIWPVDCRLYIGPSEDLQAYVGVGLQWNMLDKTTGDYDIINGSAPSKTIHQLSGNTVIGLSLLGPQKYMIHVNIGAKLHYTIADNDSGSPDDGSTDMAKDRSCVVLTGGLTLDIDRRKNACLMLNYEYPLGTPKPTTGGFWNRTQTISLGVMFHIGGTR